MVEDVKVKVNIRNQIWYGGIARVGGGVEANKTTLIEKQKSLPVIPSLLFVVGYFGITFVRSVGLLPKSWSVIPIVETAWLNFLLVLGIIIWMRLQNIPLRNVGLVQPSRSLPLLVVVTMTVDFFAFGIVISPLESFFGEAQQVARFQELPGNLPLLLLILPLSWVIAAFGEELFFRGFMLTVLAETFGDSRAAWFVAIIIQAVIFGLIHFQQGPALVIAIAIGGMVFGAAYLYAGKSLYPIILVHGITNMLGFIVLYSGG